VGSVRAASVTRRVMRRLVLSPVPVRTSVLVAQLGAPRAQVWMSLLRLERHGLVVRGAVERVPAACRCPTCGRVKRHRGGRPEATWVLTANLKSARA